MHERYQYRPIRIERGSWPSVTVAVRRAFGESLFGMWRGEIGWHTDEGIVMTVGTAAPAEIPGVIESSVVDLVATVRPLTPEPPVEDGVYAHRWFDLAESDWEEFVELSESAWPYFENAFDGTRIIGFWRTVDAPPGSARVLLMTRYESLAAWERSRPYAAVRVEEAEEARRRFIRRAELTQRTIVRIGRLVRTEI